MRVIQAAFISRLRAGTLVPGGSMRLRRLASVAAVTGILSGCSALHHTAADGPAAVSASSIAATQTTKKAPEGHVGCKVYANVSNPYLMQDGSPANSTVLLVIPADSPSPLCGYIARTSAELLMNEYGYSTTSTAPRGPHCNFMATDGSLLATAYGTVPVGAADSDTPLSGICDRANPTAHSGWDVAIGDAAMGRSADPNVAALASRF